MSSSKTNTKNNRTSLSTKSYSPSDPRVRAWASLNQAARQTLIKSVNRKSNGWFDDVLDKALSIAEDYGGFIDERVPHWAGHARKFRDKYLPKSVPKAIAKAEVKEIKRIEKADKAIPFVARPVPRRVRAVSSRTSGGVGSTSATELIFTVKSDAESIPAGTVLANIALNPTAMGMPKLSRAIKAVEKYRFDHLSFVYDPLVGTQYSGGIVWYIEYDPDDIIASKVGTKTTLEAAMAHMGAVNMPVHQKSELSYRTRFESPNLFVDGGTEDIRLTTAGRLVIVAASELKELTTYGLIACKWAVKTEVPTEDLDLPTGDFWGGYGTSPGTSPTLSDSDKFGSWHENGASTFRPEAFDSKTGKVTLQPGSYFIGLRHVRNETTATMTFSGAYISVATPGVISGWPFWEDKLLAGDYCGGMSGA